MKKIIFNGIVMLLAFSPVTMLAQSGATFKQWGEETLSKIEQDFRMPGSNLYYENTSHSAPAFAWPIGIQLHALIAAGKTAQAEALANEIHSRYWCFTNNRWAYNASAGGCGDRYYDDNAWIAKALMELYKSTNNTTYLNRARDVIAFSMSGENSAGVSPGGGIKFHEGDASGQCLCATAPTTTVNLMIYQATGIQQYLTDAQRLYSWVKANRFGYGPGYRGYENAVMTQAAILLYRITGNSTYLDDARHLGLAMETTYVDWNNHALKETGQWGGHDMTNAYVELYQLDGDVNWLNIVAGYLKFLHDNCKDANGRYPEIWSDAGVAGNPALLYQASAARAFAKIGTTPGGNPKHPDPVAVFRDCNFTGWWSSGFLIGRYTLNDLLFHGVLDNDISSVKVQPGYRVTFYENDNFTGASLVKTADQSCLVSDGWNDRVTSMVVEAVTPTAVVYKDCNYSGRAINLSVGDYPLAQLQTRSVNDNDISSLRITAGYQVQLFDGDNFTGSSITLTADNSCLVGNSWNDKATSMKVRVNCTSTVITPYISINGGASQQTSAAAVTAGGSVKMSPQPASGGSWRWTGPNGFTSTAREITITNIQTSQGGTYVTTYTNASGCESTQNFVITVNPGNVATFYKDCNYGGAGVSLPVGEYDMFALNARGIANDDISSLKVTTGYEVVVYADYNYTGTSYILTGDDACLVDNNINDWISSVRIRTKSFSATVQAENYSTMAGVQTETTTDTGGGLNVGWIDTGDWMAYNSIAIPVTGAYLVEYRVASPNSTAVLSLDLNAGAVQLGSLAVPNTGGWQNWTTVSHTVNITAGTYNVGIYAQAGGWNINWWRITQVASGRKSTASENAEPSRRFEVQSSPNPFEENVFIAVHLPSAGQTEVTVLNSVGDKIIDLYKGYLEAGHHVFAFHGAALAPGIYLFRVRHNGAWKTGKMIRK